MFPNLMDIGNLIQEFDGSELLLQYIAGLHPSNPTFLLHP